MEWSVLIKAARPVGGPLVTESELKALLDRMPGTDKRYTGGGQDFTILSWIEASDAASATAAGWQALEQAREALRLPPWTPIRTHSASARQRLTGYEGILTRAVDPRAWSVLVKTIRTNSSRVATADDRQRLQDVLGADATVGGGDDAIVARFWVDAADARAANAAATAGVRDGLDALGLTGWTIVRAHHAVASERAEEEYPGARARVLAQEAMGR
jgi:hypothetical protein